MDRALCKIQFEVDQWDRHAIISWWVDRAYVVSKPDYGLCRDFSSEDALVGRSYRTISPRPRTMAQRTLGGVHGMREFSGLGFEKPNG